MLRDNASLADCTRLDNGIIAKKLNIKMRFGAKGVRAAATANGRKTSNRFI